MPSILDVYSGCGGFSLGAHQAGFTTALAIDSDPLLTSSFPLNFPGVTLLRQDVRKIDALAIRTKLPQGVDGVIGGPPCQAFSEIGRREVNDPRRELILEFFRIVKLARPKFFIFENVRGLAFAENIGLLKAGFELLPSSWRFFGPHLLNAADFGAPTSRLRLFAFGFNRNEMNAPEEKALIRKLRLAVSVRDAISDLATALPDGYDERGFDFWRYDARRKASEYALGVRSRSGWFTGHRKTVHTEKTLKRFSTLPQGERDEIRKYARLSWDGFCPALRAGTGNDRGSYQAVRPIHPTQDRVITPREAARLQGFSDKFLFHPTVWHSFRMIGNSVSPVIARVLLKRIAMYLSAAQKGELRIAAE
jgi:DNA (cytosine-5)-methyltransferase 1